MLNVFLSNLGFSGNLASSAGYNQLPSAVASQNNEGNNNDRSHTQSEYERDLIQCRRNYNLTK